jgi:hypothetical protein
MISCKSLFSVDIFACATVFVLVAFLAGMENTIVVVRRCGLFIRIRM